MTRFLLAACAALAVAAPALAQTDVDKVKYYDRATQKVVEAGGKIVEETPTKITLKVGARSTEIPVGDLRDVEYLLSPVPKLAYRGALGNETAMLDPATRDPKKAFDDALDGFKKALAGVKDDENPFAKRHLQFLTARVLARRTDADRTQFDAAVAALQKFLKDHPDGWQVAEAGRLLGQLQELGGNKAEAVKVYEELAGRSDLPKETRLGFEFALVRSLVQSGKHPQAADRLTKMAKEIPPTDPQSAKVQVYLAECQVKAKKFAEAQTALKKILEGNADPAVKGLAANALGDCYRDEGKAEDAMWQYLWVDQLYNADKSEHARALYNLSKLFEQVKQDAAKAQACKERLLKEKEFAGLEYQKRAAREEAAVPPK